MVLRDPHQNLQIWRPAEIDQKLHTAKNFNIKSGLPDGNDRPLAYDRCRSKDGLLYRIDEPQYGFYQSDGSHLPPNQRKQGGQFRDIARWQPQPLPPNQPTLKPLPK